MRAKRSFLAKVPVQQGSISCGAAHRRRSPTIPYLRCTASALSDGFAQHVVIADMVGASAKEFFEPNLYLFDAYPGGIGFSEPLFRAHELLVEKTRELIAACGCEQGCPSCVGPAGDLAPRAKEAALAILDRLCA